MDPFYLGIPTGPTIPPVDRARGIAPISRDEPHQQSPQQQLEDEEDEFADEEEADDDLEPLETYDDHGRLHELGIGDGGLPAAAHDVPPALPMTAADAAETEDAAEAVDEPVADAPTEPGERRRHGDGGHIDISV